MTGLKLYSLLDRVGISNYRAKIMLTAFAGTHVPLIALVGYIALQSGAAWESFFATLLVALCATLGGAGLTLWALHALLAPVSLTSKALRDYVQTRRLAPLPTKFGDEVGALMADTAETLSALDATRVRLESIDAATGLPNRRKLLADLEARPRETPFVVRVFRFANVAKITETFDRREAETAAAEIARRLSSALTDIGALYRLSAGDFAALSSQGALTATAIEKVSAEILARCGDDLNIRGMPVIPVLRVGVATCPNDSDNPETVVDLAVAAAAEAHAVNFHSPAARLASMERLRVEQDLRKALAREEFVLHFQPVIDLAERRATGAEALIRWRHPQMGLLAPGRFIDVAEASGLIDPIGRWVFQTACQQIRTWSDGGLTGMKVAVNLSARQFGDSDLIRHVREAMDGAGVDPSQLEIELTETAAMADYERTRHIFTRLRDCGVSIAIDDFGAGYAGMSYLRKLPFDKLKIDREFVTDVHLSPENQAICGAMSALADGLHLRLLAEGVEKPEEFDFLRSRGCNLYQGFYFAKPMPAGEFPIFAASYQPTRVNAAA